MRRAIVSVLALLACGDRSGSPSPASTGAVGRDAGGSHVRESDGDEIHDGSAARPAIDKPNAVLATPAVSAPATVSPDPQCTFYGAMERIELRTDLVTMTGTLTRSSPGANHYRKIKYQLVPDGDTAFDLVFLGYGPGDYPPIRNWRGTSPPREHMTVGRSIVARVAVVGNLARIFGREVDLHTNMTYQTRDHSYPCALIDSDFDKAHPGEFLPRDARPRATQ